MKTKTCFLLSAAIVAAVSIPLRVANAGPTSAPVTDESLRKGLVLHLTFDRDETAAAR